jgi:glutamate carboxypeptidase
MTPPAPDRLLAFCATEQAWLLETIEALVRLESPSTDKAAVDRCGTELARRLTGMGGRVLRLAREARGDIVRAEFFPHAAGRQILLLGHFDTVWPLGQIERMPFRADDGRLYGPGVFDMKAGIAVAMLAVRALRHAAVDPPRVVMLWTTDEEIGSTVSRAAIEKEARQSSAVLVLEPSLPDGAAKTSRKGCGEFTLIVQGVPAHAGIDPDKGASAIVELAHQILAIQALRDPSRGLSVNVGVVAGGSRANVVAEEARATIDVRVASMADVAPLEASLGGLTPRVPGTRLTITGGVDRPPLERSEAVVGLYRIARDVARSLGRDLAEGSTGGGSDGNFTAALGVPTLDGLGPMGDGAHAHHEHVLMTDLAWRAALLSGLLARIERVE